MTSLTLGTVVYNQLQLLSILSSPVKGDASIILAKQLIAAKLNIANGSDPTPIAATIATAVVTGQLHVAVQRQAILAARHADDSSGGHP